MGGFGWGKRLLATLGVSLLVAAALSSSAFAAATNGYTASVTTSGTVRVGDTSPGVIVYVKITNTSTGSGAYKLGSANATFTGFSLVAGSAAIVSAQTTGGANWKATISGNILQIRTSESGSNYLPACTGLSSCKFVTAQVKLATAPITPGQKTVTTDAKTDGDHDGDGSPVPRSGSDPSVAVMPGPLASFKVLVANQIGQAPKPPVADQVAGAGFPVQATAFDKYGNVKTDYDGSGAVLSGNLGSSLRAPAGETTLPV